MIKNYDGVVLAGMGTYINRVKQTIENRHYHFEDDFTKSIKAGLECFGAHASVKTLLKNPEKVLQRTHNKMANTTEEILTDDFLYMIDSGGFQVISGKFNMEYVSLISTMYAKYINKNILKNAVYFYYDITPSNGITSKEAYSYISDFHDDLISNPKNNAANVYFVYQGMTKTNYDLYTKFIKEKNIPNSLNSHRWAVGGVVPINVNDKTFKVRPYLIPLFNIIKWERDYLISGGHVHYHVLGASSIYDMIMFSWFSIYAKEIGFNIHFTFDSTSAIYSATKNGYIPYTNEKGIPMIIRTEKKCLSWPVGNSEDPILKNNELGILQIIQDYIENYKCPEIEKFLDSKTWYTDTGKWSQIFLVMMCSYAFYSTSKMSHAIRGLFDKNKSLLTDDLYNEQLFRFTSEIIMNTYLKSNPSLGLKLTKFKRNIYGTMARTFNEFKNILHGKSHGEFIDQCHYVANKKYKFLNTEE